MRILIFIYAFEAGGAQRRVISLANSFHAAGHDVAIVVIDNDGALQQELAEDVQVYTLGSPVPHWLAGGNKRSTRLLGACLRLARLLRRQRVDILLAGANHVILCSLLGHFFTGGRHEKKQLVLRFSNTLSGDRKKRSLTRPLKIAVMRRLVSRASTLIAVSGDVAGDVARRLKIGREQLHVLPNPVIDTGVNRSAGRNPDHRWLRDGQIPVVLGVGRLHAQKDFATLIKAFAWLRNKQEARLIIYGEGEERGHLQHLAETSGHGDAIDLPGHHPCPWLEMRHADLLVLSSRWEGMPGVLIEAMAAGCPVVSTDCPGGSREILQDGVLGTLVPVQDPQAMADAMLTMLDAPVDRQALRAAASRYDVQEAARAYLEVFERTVGNDKHNSRR